MLSMRWNQVWHWITELWKVVSGDLKDANRKRWLTTSFAFFVMGIVSSLVIVVGDNTFLKVRDNSIAVGLVTLNVDIVILGLAAVSLAAFSAVVWVIITEIRMREAYTRKYESEQATEVAKQNEIAAQYKAEEERQKKIAAENRARAAEFSLREAQIQRELEAVESTQLRIESGPPPHGVALLSSSSTQVEMDRSDVTVRGDSDNGE